MLHLSSVLVVLTAVAAFADAGENATSVQGRKTDSGTPFKKSYWTKSKMASWSIPTLSTDVVAVKSGEMSGLSANFDRSTSPGESGAGKKADALRPPMLANSPSTNSGYYHEFPSAITNIANFENARARDYGSRYNTQPPRSLAVDTGPRIVDIVMPDAYRTPRWAKPQGIASPTHSDRYVTQESTRNGYYYETPPKKNDKFDNRERNRRYDYDYDSRELDGPHSDRREDHWDEWDDYHYDHHRYYDHKHHHKKDYDYLLPLLLLILAPLAVSSFLMPVTATLITNSMYFAGAQGAIYQGRKRRSVDARQEHRDLLVELARLLEESMARFENGDGGGGAKRS